MTYKIEDYTITLHESVKLALQMFKQTGARNERGGILLGSIYEKKIVINRVSIPTIFDSSSKFSFVRDKKSAQLFIDYEFTNSGGKIIYLGEWHTHPEESPTPSSTDIIMIKKQLKENFTNEQFLLLLIVGLKENYLGFYNGNTLTKIS